MSCGKRTTHTSRIGCCAGCKELFSSDSAFEKHRRRFVCLDPVEAGLVARPSRSAPDETIWGLPGPTEGRGWALASQDRSSSRPQSDEQARSGIHGPSGRERPANRVTGGPQ